VRLAGLTVLAVLLFAPAGLRAANVCPWTTQGSAATALGGDPVATVQVSESGEGFCSYSVSDSVSKNTLKIVVRKAALPQTCPAGSSELKGVGNEAVMCTIRRSAEVVGLIASRVRAQHFTVTITLHRKGMPNPEFGHYEDALKVIAEQVAGSLF